ncbi:fluoroacetyl-CoA thioesterase [Pycnococcus provasolii]
MSVLPPSLYTPSTLDSRGRRLSPVYDAYRIAEQLNVPVEGLAGSGASSDNLVEDGVDPRFPNAKLPPIAIGTELTVTYKVASEDLAASARSGGVVAMSTSTLLEVIESACVDCVKPFVEAGFITIGSCVQIRHTTPVPEGCVIQVKVVLSQKLRRALTFDVRVVFATNPGNVVAKGFHQRSYLKLSEIEEKLVQKDKERRVLAPGLEGMAVHYIGPANTVGVAQGAREASLVSSAVTTSTLMKWCEEACINALEEVLPPGQTSVGGSMLITHQAAALQGMVIECKAKLSTMDKRKLTFEVWANDRSELVAKATHVRFLVLKEDFERHAQASLVEQASNAEELAELASVV